MCQLTFLGGDPALVKSYLINLTILNVNDGNRDGFGLYEIPDEKQSGLVWKRDKSGSGVVLEEDFFKVLDGFEKPTLNIMSHVRAASRGFAVNYDNTHPFRIDNLILAHNGTLEPDNVKLEIKDKIDSFWFLTHLAKIVNKKELTELHIIEAMKAFRGKFAFLIGDLLNPEILWVVRGKAPLYYTKLRCNEKEVMFMINTDKINLSRCIAKYFLYVATKKKYIEDDPQEFDEESIYKYNVKTKSLVKTSAKIIERPTIINIIAPVSDDGAEFYLRNRERGIGVGFVPPNANMQYSKYINEDNAIADLESVSVKFGLTTLELNLAHLMLSNEPLIFSTPDSVKDVTEFLMKFDGSFTMAKAEIWKNIVQTYKKTESKHVTILDIYENLEVKFPYFLHSKNELKNVLNRIEKRTYNRKKPSKSIRN